MSSNCCCCSPIGLKADLERQRRGRPRGSNWRCFASTARSAGYASARRGRCAIPATIVELFRERLAAIGDELDAGYGFDVARLSVLAKGDFDGEQGDFAQGGAAGDPDVALLLDRIAPGSAAARCRRPATRSPARGGGKPPAGAGRDPPAGRGISWH